MKPVAVCQISPGSTVSGLWQSREKPQVLSFVLVIFFPLKSESPGESPMPYSSSVCEDNDIIYLRFLPEGNELASANEHSAGLTGFNHGNYCFVYFKMCITGIE